jgi:site-specific recombinase XerD
MTNPAASTSLGTDDSDLLHPRGSFIRHLAADRRTPATRRAYNAAVAQLEAFLVERGLPTAVTELTPDHLEAFIVSLHQRGMRSTTILARHHALSRFFGWLVAENELATSPMASIPAPAARLPEPQVLTGEEVAALLASCDGDEFEYLRDTAIIRLLLDTGLRATELAALQLDDLDLDSQTAYVAGQGRVPRAAPFDLPAARALERYLVARALHRRAHLPDLWLWRRGRLTDRGVDLAVRHRGRLAGLRNLHPQRLRHTYVQQYLADGGSGRDLMRLVGWKSRQLVGRYQTGTLAERPQAEWLRLGDRLQDAHDCEPGPIETRQGRTATHRPAWARSGR